LTGKPQATITLYNYVKYEPWKYTKYCCDVGIQKFVANVGHRVFEGYWQSESTGWPSINTLDLCSDNIQDHGQYRDDIPGGFHILSGCTEMTVDIFNNNHIALHDPVGDSIFLERGDQSYPPIIGGHPNYTQSKGCLAPSFWYNGECHVVQPLPKPLATTSVHCYEAPRSIGKVERCESGDWIPVKK